MQTFLTFKNFVGFGQFINIDLRIEVRNLLTGKISKRFYISTKIAAYEAGDTATMSFEVSERLKKMLKDLCGMIAAEGLTSEANRFTTWTLETIKEVEMEEYYTGEMSVMLFKIFSLNEEQMTM